ncbi:YcaO-like family protein [Romboutsia sp. 1001285H_161024_C4]|uniref:YcaO-like family protein n=1 Tax=Romboutsia sp. 1001285H_161024_C4 TaxID=2787109 RepID=UPI00189963BA|nr:YcaO-like family protein [Romboutsia sp. 1001285H_161024_C4]
MACMNKFKDELPNKTIEKIKNILSDLGCETIEEWSPSGVNNLFSVRVYIKGTNIAANGKGSIKEYALASGYAELIERLQNLINFRLTSLFFLFTKDNKFDISPDEIKYNSFDLSKYDNKPWLKQAFGDIFQDEILLKKYFMLQEFTDLEEVIYLPFKNITNDEDMPMPILLFDIVYGTNGMASGNSKEEAMVQALSEIIERKVTCEMLNSETTLPDITSYVRNRYEVINEIISNIESSKSNDECFSVSIKDCSLNKNYPTISVILFEKKSNKYFVSQGTHPILEVAVERTLTEIMQGRNIKEISYMMSDLNDDYSKYDLYENRKGIFKNGEGVYPLSVFSYTGDATPNSEIWKYDFKNNSEMLNSLINLIENKGYSIYYRDASFLGFNTYQIVIPGFSEINNRLIKDMDNLIEQKRMRDLYKNINNLSKDEIYEFVSLLDRDLFSPELSLNEILILPLTEVNPLHNITKDCLLIILYSIIEDYENAYKSSLRFLDFIIRSNSDKEIVDYYKNVSSILYMKKNNLSNQEIRNVLTNFHEDNIINAYLEELDKDNIRKNLPKVSCPNCTECDINQYCCFENDKVLYNKLMNMQKIYFSKKHVMSHA